jgi:hypothetical protein
MFVEIIDHRVDETRVFLYMRNSHDLLRKQTEILHDFWYTLGNFDVRTVYFGECLLNQGWIQPIIEGRRVDGPASQSGHIFINKSMHNYSLSKHVEGIYTLTVVGFVHKLLKVEGVREHEKVE